MYVVIASSILQRRQAIGEVKIVYMFGHVSQTAIPLAFEARVDVTTKHATHAGCAKFDSNYPGQYWQTDCTSIRGLKNAPCEYNLQPARCALR